MAQQFGILERYGIKEVADVVFIDISNNKPVLYLDSLKVSTIEETAENTEARGGKGNAPLISWDYGKDINVSITDALYSPKSLTLMHTQNMSDLHVYDSTAAGLPVTKYRNMYVDASGKIEDADVAASGIFDVTATSDATTYLNAMNAKDAGHAVAITGTTFFKVYRAEDNAVLSTASDIVSGQAYIVEYQVAPKNKSIININADTFPGTYKVIGDTYSRNNRTGKDQFFQFVINKAKINPETTITLEAEGDPTVFDMSLKVLRPNSGTMMKLIQYDFDSADDNTGIGEIQVVAGGTSGDVTQDYSDFIG
jgi:hypothetical protein